ncbi:hypothetical protein O2N63_16280 [Aliiroseovarius sp. KMU-50]|uniref:VWA domain-containing protein n=1 Tax=Aliiroseovarius salicola TaxID=3009082 RepID=A0ABT4W549_9RHOB|nr:hypothetical protein [Aliiroseovarius sp. KMU-50]MDA5095649.1 hypothetical protein [Aliiroseovarius sp. KMU-50]
MTALKKYDRLEAPGVWCASPEAQRVNVIVSLGEASLTLTDMSDRALTHWSLAAVRRINPGTRPARFSPSDENYEELEIDDDTMIDGIERVRKVVEKRRDHPGRLRGWMGALTLAGLISAGVFWLPDALRSYTAKVVPATTRAAIGQQILNQIGRVAGRQCEGVTARSALDALGRRVLGADAPRLIILSDGVQTATHLPGKITLLNRALIEDYEEPAVAAGFILAEDQRRRETDPMLGLLNHAGLKATVQLLTTGKMPKGVVDIYAEWLLTSDPAELDPDALLPRFAEADIPSTPYAYALDLTGEKTISLIEADPVPLSAATPLLSDDNWVRLQGVCGE